MTETALKTAAVKWLKKEFPTAWIYHPSDKWLTGIPDLLIVCGGRFWAIELKVNKNTPTKLQIKTLAEIEEAGSQTAVCWSLEEVKEFANTYIRSKK